MTQETNEVITTTLQYKEALPIETRLQETYQLESVLSADRNGFTYLAKDEERSYRIRELFPHHLVHRAEDALQVEQDHDLEAVHSHFRKTAEFLQAERRHFLHCTAMFEENGTLCCLFPWEEMQPMDAVQLELTPAYVRSLGISLCDAYEQLHAEGRCYGTLTTSDILFDQRGSMYLNPDRLFEQEPEETMDPLQDLHCLVSFLQSFLTDFTEDYQELGESPALPVLREVLAYTYPDAATLKAALLCTEGKCTPPERARSQKKTAVIAVLCAVFLLASIAASLYFATRKQSLSVLLEKQKISPGVIDVWIPLAEDADEQRVQLTYERLTQGFERKYPGFGINLLLFADGSFEETMQLRTEDTVMPAVFMNTEHPDALSLAADLSPLTSELDDLYLFALDDFTEILPLGCSVPALYSHSSIESTVISYESLNGTIVLDSSVDVLSPVLNAETSAGDFAQFLETRDASILASSAYTASVQQNAQSSGAVTMQPVSVADRIPLLLEMPCIVNRDLDKNAQRIGMLWLQYLLTEEAQSILFVENYGILPLHETAFDAAVGQHSTYAVLSDLKDQFTIDYLEER